MFKKKKARESALEQRRDDGARNIDTVYCYVLVSMVSRVREAKDSLSICHMPTLPFVRCARKSGVRVATVGVARCGHKN